MPLPVFSSKRKQLILNNSHPIKPVKKIVSAEEVEFFRESEGLSRIMAFILSLCESVIGIKCSEIPEPSTAVVKIIDILNKMDYWLEEIPLSDEPQRFGNPVFKIFIERLNNFSLNLFPEWEIELRSYFLNSFGNSIRLDYGTGHELNFFIFLTCLDLLGYFSNSNFVTIIHIVERYTQLIKRILKVYHLEPAGSHGVWGLDDYFFLPYLLGAHQLLLNKNLKPKSTIIKDILDSYHKEYLYLDAVFFVLQMKSGPFHEHSPYLHDISNVLKWEKVSHGLIKMYVAEVLEKFPIVQHVEFGFLIPWEPKHQ
jgi:serine/threonine-protein phosphatase 2A activator